MATSTHICLCVIGGLLTDPERSITTARCFPPVRPLARGPGRGEPSRPVLSSRRRPRPSGHLNTDGGRCPTSPRWSGSPDHQSFGTLGLGLAQAPVIDGPPGGDRRERYPGHQQDQHDQPQHRLDRSGGASDCGRTPASGRTAPSGYCPGGTRSSDHFPGAVTNKDGKDRDPVHGDRRLRGARTELGAYPLLRVGLVLPAGSHCSRRCRGGPGAIGPPRRDLGRSSPGPTGPAARPPQDLLP